MAQGFARDYIVKATGETSVFVNGVKQNSTSGTSIDFTIPRGVKHIKLLLDGVSTSGTSKPIMRIGDSGGIEATGYKGSSGNVGAASVATELKTTGWGINSAVATRVLNGVLYLDLLDAATNTWIGHGSIGASDTAGVRIMSGSKSLSDELTTVRITTEGGTDTFDAGVINVQYENPNLAVSGVESVAAGVTDVFVNGVKQSTTSGTSKDFTIPAGVKQFSVCFDSVSIDAVTDMLIQLGDSGGVEATGYISNSTYSLTNSASDSSTIGFVLNTQNASFSLSGVYTFYLMDEATNTWVGMGNHADSGLGDYTFTAAGRKALSGELTTVRITSTSGTANFDSGSINVLYDNPNLDLGSGVISGGVVQTVNVRDGEAASGTTTVALDDTIPQNTELNEFMTASITPTNVANKLKIETTVHLTHSTGTPSMMVAALFQDSTANALAVGTAARNPAIGALSQITFTHWMTAGTTSSTTFKVRAGSHIAGTTYFNADSSGNRYWGGVYASTITITEYKV